MPIFDVYHVFWFYVEFERNIAISRASPDMKWHSYFRRLKNLLLQRGWESSSLSPTKEVEGPRLGEQTMESAAPVDAAGMLALRNSWT